MKYTFMIFPKSYIIANDKPIRGTLSLTIDRENIIEMSKNIDEYIVRRNKKTYTFASYGCVSCTIETNNVYRTMINMLFLYGSVN